MSSTERYEEHLCVPYIEAWPLILTKLRSEILDPNVVWSRIDNVEAKDIIPNTEQPLLNLMKERNERPEPRVTRSNTDTLEPRRERP
jgi:hypothetical protein